jgi:hypothetical protein
MKISYMIFLILQPDNSVVKGIRSFTKYSRKALLADLHLASSKPKLHLVNELKSEEDPNKSLKTKLSAILSMRGVWNRDQLAKA